MALPVVLPTAVTVVLPAISLGRPSPPRHALIPPNSRHQGKTRDIQEEPCTSPLPSLVRSVRIVELPRADKHDANNRHKRHDGDNNDPGAFEQHFLLPSSLPPPPPPAPLLFWRRRLRSAAVVRASDRSGVSRA